MSGEEMTKSAVARLQAIGMFHTTERPALQPADLESQVPLEDRAGGASGVHLMAGEEFAVERGPFEQVTLLVVVGD
jgi:hypothetical protein